MVNFAGDNFTGGNVKLSLLSPIYHSQPDNLDIVLGGGIRIERVDYLTQEKYYGYATTINSFEVGIITGLRYKILPELRFFLLPSFYYSPHTIFENKIYEPTQPFLFAFSDSAFLFSIISGIKKYLGTTKKLFTL